MSKVIALIVAGGSGSRFSSSIPKQYINSTLTKTILKFLSSNLIDSVQVVIRPEDIELYRNATKNFNLLPVAFGGESRAQSVINGLNSIKQYNPEIVLVHDANRPFLCKKLINNIIEQLQLNPNHGIIPATPISDTIKRINSKNDVTVLNRDNLFSIQTPQGFYYNQLLAAYNQAEKYSTDESSLNIPVIYISGEINNIKITYQEDLQMEIRSGIGFDAHRFSLETSENNHIILGGISINSERKLEAHSDGDVLIHALVDAILGSIGAGDIGMHFPPSDAEWKNADSKLFLEFANKLLQDKNGYINNIDVTVICEDPKIGPYRENISNNLAKILKINEDRINIKATTTEKMGFTGRKEGIAVQVITIISLPV